MTEATPQKHKGKSASQIGKNGRSPHLNGKVKGTSTTNATTIMTKIDMGTATAVQRTFSTRSFLSSTIPKSISSQIFFKSHITVTSKPLITRGFLLSLLPFPEIRMVSL